MKNPILLLLLFVALASPALGKTLKVAIIDTGLDSYKVKNTTLCKEGHKDFVNDKPLTDYHGHGTNISGIIEEYAKGKDYCQIIYKFYSASAPGSVNLANMIKSIKAAIDAKVDFINISGGGVDSNPEEKRLIKLALDKGITVVAAAGNDHLDLDKECKYFPACYDKRVVVVGSVDHNLNRLPSSSYGSVVDYEAVGEKVCANGICLTGTSQATAKVTGVLIRSKLK